jgi:small ligand-binding sensory domain FIST
VLEKYSVAGYLPGKFDEQRLTEWARGLRQELGQAPHLGLLFMSPDCAPDAAAILDIIRLHGQVPVLAGCTGASLVANHREIEGTAGMVLCLYHLPGASLKGFHLTQSQVEEANGPAFWYAETGLGLEQTNGWLVFADPFTFDTEAWLKQWNDAYAGLSVVGGLASGSSDNRATQIFLNGEVFDEGAVLISVAGKVQVSAVVSQGCTPIGEPWTITQSERNFIRQIGNRPAYKVLMDTFHGLDLEEQRKARGNLFIGLAMSEYLEQFHRGDFLIRNLLGGDPKSGALAVGALPRTGQTLQFQRRDAAAATEDMVALLERAKTTLAGKTIYGGCLCACNGRGIGLFGAPNHDAELVQKHLGPLGVAGFFCNGEIGPVGPRNYVHGYTAALGLLVEVE